MDIETEVFAGGEAEITPAPGDRCAFLNGEAGIGGGMVEKAGNPDERGERQEGAVVEAAASFTAVGDAFSRLAQEQRSLLWLREVEGQSHEVRAEILQIRIGTVKSRLLAAREELRRIWHSPRSKMERSLPSAS